MPTTKKEPIIGIVGPCSSGKSTLVAGLKSRGITTKPIAQEHSYVKDMWLRFTNPDILIFLQVSYPIAQKRRKLNWGEKEYEVQQYRLRDALENADFFLDTDNLRPENILNKVLGFIEKIE